MSSTSTVDVVSTLKGIVEECEVGKWTSSMGLVLDPRDFSYSFGDYRGAWVDSMKGIDAGKLLFKVDHHFNLHTILNRLRATAIKKITEEVLAEASMYTTWTGQKIVLPSMNELDMDISTKEEFASEAQYRDYLGNWREDVRYKIEYRFIDVDTLELV